MDAYFDDEPGYRVRADEFALPEISLESDEASVVALATKVWEHARLAEATTDAVSKLSAAGLALDLGALDIAQPRLSADEPAFDVFWEATVARRAVTFDYQRPGYDAPLTRHLQPWGVVRFSGRWYAVGLDTDRGEERVFRLSRVVGPAKAVGNPGAVRDPARHRRPRGRPAARARRRRPRRRCAGPTRGRGGPEACGRERRARRRRPRRRDAVGPAPARRVAPRPTSCSLSVADVYVERPVSLRDEVVARLRAAAGAIGMTHRDGGRGPRPGRSAPPAGALPPRSGAGAPRRGGRA